ncbi:hypothetical protein [Actinoallomurus vinaceus]|uniref:hypothetical protein n=1 Tax=Actinoallomurus vinaceus TaxID=1080074 RepID=UPI0031EB1B42
MLPQFVCGEFVGDAMRCGSQGKKRRREWFLLSGRGGHAVRSYRSTLPLFGGPEQI